MTAAILLFNSHFTTWRILGMRRKQNFEIVFGFKSDTAILTFSFRFLSTPLHSILLSFFFLFLDFVLEGKVFEITVLNHEFAQHNFFSSYFYKILDSK